MGLFDSRRVTKHKNKLAALSGEFLAEDERVYRNQVQLFSEEFSPASPKARGIYKSRLFGACFLIAAFRLRWPHRQDDAFEVLQAMSGFAFLPLGEPNADPALDIDEARSLGKPYAFTILDHIADEVAQGPSKLPRLSDGALGTYSGAAGLSPERAERVRLENEGNPEGGFFTAGLRGLCDCWHDALSESVGTNSYTSVARERFSHIAEVVAFSHLRYMSDLLSDLS